MKPSEGTPRSIRLKEYNPGLVRITRPGDSYFKTTDGSLERKETTLRSDNNGFLLTGNNLSENRKKFVILGDSFVESYWAFPETSRWVSVAERQLEQVCKGKYALLNGGYSGVTSLNMALQIPAKIRPLYHDLAGVILFVPLNDAIVSDLPHSYWTKNRYWSPITPTAHSGDLPQEPFDSDLDTKSNWYMMLQYLKLHEIPALVVATPYRTGTWGSDKFITSSFESTKKFIQWRKKQNTTIDIALKAAKKFGAATMDTREFSWRKGGTAPWFYDRLHLNSQGHEYFGKTFTDALLKTNFWESEHPVSISKIKKRIHQIL